jgi:hypothetical protein
METLIEPKDDEVWKLKLKLWNWKSQNGNNNFFQSSGPAPSASAHALAGSKRTLRFAQQGPAVAKKPRGMISWMLKICVPFL